MPAPSTVYELRCRNWYAFFIASQLPNPYPRLGGWKVCVSAARETLLVFWAYWDGY